MNRWVRNIILGIIGIISLWYIAANANALYIFVVLPGSNALTIIARKLFDPDISKQLSTFSPTHVVLPDGYKPERIDVASQDDQFIVYAGTVDGKKKTYKIFLIDSVGKIIFQIDAQSGSGTPYTVKNLGFIIPYCSTGSNCLYTIGADSIAFTDGNAPAYTPNSPLRVPHARITDDGALHNLSANIAYSVESKDDWGSRFYFNAILSMNGKNMHIKDFYLREYLPLSNGKTVMIFSSSFTHYNETNELFIF